MRRRRYRVLALAALIAAIGVPVGFALSIEPSVRTASTQNEGFARPADILAHPPEIVANMSLPAPAVSVASPVISLPRSPAPSTSTASPTSSTLLLFGSHLPFLLGPFSSAAKLLGVGTALFGLAALVRRSV